MPSVNPARSGTQQLVCATALNCGIKDLLASCPQGGKKATNIQWQVALACRSAPTGEP